MGTLVSSAPLRAPFPWYGGKSRVASVVWAALGDVANYVEPFFGSGAVLLARPHVPRMETVNDINAFIANFWRAVAADPAAVAFYADHPVNETDLHARHRWLVAQGPRLAADLEADPHAFDAKVAGWWAWGLSQWIGGGWCAGALYRRSPRAFGHFRGNGVHAADFDWTLFDRLAERLRPTRVKCVDWIKCLSTGPLYGDLQSDAVAGVFLDPPYAHNIGRDDACYGDHDDGDVAAKARAWCIEHGKNPRLRIVLAGYDVEHSGLEEAGWRVAAWESAGFRLTETSKENARRERLWFSPHCLDDTRQPGLFDTRIA